MARGLTARIGPIATPRRRWALAALAAGVLTVHGCVTQGLAERMTELAPERAMPERIEVAYVRDMALAAAPAAAAPAAPAPTVAQRTAPKPKPKPKPPPKPASAPEVTAPVIAAASAPEPAASEPAAEVAAAASATDAGASAASAPAAEAAVVAAAPASAPASSPADAAPAFEWPASTRMSYLLTGNYRGEVSGSAQVEWIRVGSRYQVHLDLVIGPSVAPIITRRMSSDGEITADGLAPRRYDQDTKVVLRDRHRATIAFEPGSVVLANGERRDAVPGVQDTASQFVQLTYVFSTKPELLRTGSAVDIPLALPHKVDVWTYDVVGEDTLYTRFGELPAIHLKPRRSGPPKVGELSAEIWFAPQLRYLPVRILIRQDESNFVDLLISKKPEMAK